jgi:uncharacterized protein
MRIAIIGSGIAGLTAARRCPPTTRSRSSRPTTTSAVTPTPSTSSSRAGSWAVDTGFIVFNDWTYPNFIALMNEIGVESQPSDMGFACAASAPAWSTAAAP